MKISYKEYNVLEDLIKSSDALESFRDGTLSFLDEVSTKIEDAINSSKESFVDTNIIFVDVEVPIQVQEILFEKLNLHPAVELLNKFVK